MRKTDPFKVLILIALCANLSFSFYSSFDIASVQHQIGDMHEHISEVKYISDSSCDCGEYQIDLELDGVMVYDGDRVVGFIPNMELNTRSALDSLFISDNQ